MSDRKVLSIMLWNAQSIRLKIDELTDFLNSNQIDICLISETWLISTETCSVPNYSLYRKDRPSPTNNKRNVGGGVAIAIRNDIPHNQLPDLGLNIIESIGIEVCGIRFYSIYFPGSKLNSHKHQAFKSDIIKISSIRNKFLVGGDLNSKHRFWNCVKSNTAGKILFDEMHKRNFMLHFPDSPTYYPPQRNRTTPSTVDLFLTNGFHNIVEVQANNELSSDHLPVTFKLELGNTFQPKTTSKRCYAKANWSTFKSYLNDKIDLLTAPYQLSSISMIDVSIDNLTKSIKEAENQAIPIVQTVFASPPLSDSLRRLISLRNCKRRQWQRDKSRSTKKVVNFLNRLIKFQIKATNNERWNHRLSSLKKHSNQLWKVTKLVKNQTTKIPPLKVSSKILTTDSDKANEIGSAFCKAHSTTFNDLSDHSTESSVKMSCNNIKYFNPLMNESIMPSPREISKIIRKLKNKKSPGDDLINNVLLKHLPKKAIIMLMHIFKACFKLSYFPDIWKCAKIVPIPKAKKDPALACNYRPISLLNSLSKIFEKIILNRLTTYISSHNVLIDEQFGFRDGHSTNHQLLRVTKYIQSALQNKHSVGMVTFDIEKAFDSVWHKGLVHKMFILKFPLYLIKIIQSYLHKRSFYVSVNGHKSKIFHILAGLPQGSVLSPTLYNIYTSDLNITSSEKAFFADDSCLYTSGKSPTKIIKKLNAAGKQLTDYSTKWKIKLNDAKTNAAFFTRRTANKWLPSEGVTIRNARIPWKNSVKYLGVTLDKTVTFKTHIDLISEKALKFVGILYPLLNRKSKLNSDNKIRIFRAIIQSILLGACPVWGNCAKHHIEKLQIIQNKCLKIILDLPPRYETINLHKLAAIQPIKHQITKINSKFNNKLLTSDNPIIRNLH
jgi:hypothetical protein